MQEIRQKRTYDLDALEELLSSLMDASSQGAAVIVEGRRDELALRSLGLRGPMIMASRRLLSIWRRMLPDASERSSCSRIGMQKEMRWP